MKSLMAERIVREDLPYGDLQNMKDAAYLEELDELICQRNLRK